MPVTAKLSQKFYAALGDEVATELVEWFNAVDLTYRTDLRELNELNFSRFDARLDQRVAASEGRLDQRITEVETRLAQRITEVETKLGQRITEVDTKLAQQITAVTARIDQVEESLKAKIDRELAASRMETEAGFARLRLELAAQRADTVKWLFLFWLGTVAATVAARLL